MGLGIPVPYIFCMGIYVESKDDLTLKFLDKFERKFGKFAIRNLPFYIVLCFGIGYFLVAFLPDVYLKLYFSPYDILVNHEFWRLFTWIFSPPEELTLLSLIMLFFYYVFGQAIERGIGTFLFNVYILGGWLLNTLSCLGVSIFYYAKYGDSLNFQLWSLMNNGVEMMSYMIYSLFLGFALVYADSMVLFMFFLPMKASWFAYIDMAYLAYRFVSTASLLSRVSIIAYLVNFFLLYLLMRNYTKRRRYASKTQRIRQREYNRQVVDFEKARQAMRGGNSQTSAKSVITRHKCAVCGRSELDDPNLEFRFCSKCIGNYEYCSDHLYTHEHIKE